MLSDPEKRRVYDQLGEEGLKAGMGASSSGMPGGAANFRSMEEVLKEVGKNIHCSSALQLKSTKS